MVHILSPETDNCLPWISGRERMTLESSPWSISTKECCRPGGGWTRNLLVRHIRFSEMRKTIHRTAHLTNEYVIWLLKLEIYWKYCGKEEKLLLLFSTIFCYLLLDVRVKTGTRFSLRDKRLFEISEVAITRVDCIKKSLMRCFKEMLRLTCLWLVGLKLNGPVNTTNVMSSRSVYLTTLS